MSDPVLSHIHARLVRKLRRYNSEVAEIKISPRLVAVLSRLPAALEAADTGQEVPDVFKDELIALGPPLRRYALSLTCDGVEADDLVQFTLLKA
ncbi:hypothetical protein [Methylobacterium sp. P5_C11]